MLDLHAEQVRLEECMVSLGIEKYRASFQENMSDGLATDTRSVSTAMDAAPKPKIVKGW